MSQISILQIGDIHYPETEKLHLADVKDSGLAATLRESISPKALAAVFSELAQVANSGSVNAIAVCGDLTSRGDLEGYKHCVAYLDQALSLNLQPKNTFHVVPGNHDVDRLLADRSINTLEKFAPLVQAWRDAGFPDALTTEFRHTTVAETCGSAELLSLNSCIGCGEHRFLPEVMRDELKTLRGKLSEDPASAQAFDLLAEQLDTPAFELENINAATRLIESLDSSSIPILIAHHNILPQARVRLDVYTELINSGLVRSRLCDCHKPVVYLHGHIHDDPVEVVTNGMATGTLISISAPEIEKGFNLIEMHFSPSRQPLGCVLTRYRLSRHAAVRPDNPLRIPFVTPDCFDSTASEISHKVLASLEKKSSRFRDVVEGCRSYTKKKTSESRIEQGIRELHWFNLIDVQGINMNPLHWHIHLRGEG